ncbi:TPA: site-specific DNA-methyltransferase, partial [Campylobacter lari]|nr:site-specific DNA-methyltransferase [Campylobacter lari]
DNLSKMYSIFSGYWTSDGNEEIENIFNGKLIFENPKPTKLIKEIFFANAKKDDIILDFFAGSGTTAQAVMELNAQDNGNRKFILVQLDEKIDEKKSKVAYDFCKNELSSQNPVISDITIERVKRAGEKIAKENADKNLDLGFKVFSMVEKPELVCDGNDSLNLINHAKLSPYEKALNLALQDCKTLDNDLKMILKDKIYQCEQSFYVINFDDEVLNFLKNTQNENVYINGFGGIDLEIYLNLESFLKERLKVVY